MVSNLNAWQIMQMGAYAPSSINLIHETYLIIYILTLWNSTTIFPIKFENCTTPTVPTQNLAIYIYSEPEAANINTRDGGGWFFMGNLK